MRSRMDHNYFSLQYKIFLTVLIPIMFAPASIAQVTEPLDNSGHPAEIRTRRLPEGITPEGISIATIS